MSRSHIGEFTVYEGQNWNRTVDPGANFLVWLLKRQTLVLREPAFEFSTLAQETEPGSVQTRVYRLSRTRCSQVFFLFFFFQF